MAEMTIQELVARFSLGGEWRVSQVAKMCGWSIWTVYRYISEGKFGEDAVVIRGERQVRVKGEAIAAYLRSLNQ